MLAREDVRLLTLVGPPGVGKTRLAIAVAERMTDHFADGACFVPLSSVADPRQLNPAVVQSLRLRPAHHEADADRLKQYLREKNLLLVLDNFEQLLAAAPGVADLLSVAPYLKVLVTSRAALRLSAEHEYEVRPLEVPDPRHLPPLERMARISSVDLFTRRAQAIKPNFTLTQANASDVSAICIHLDGLPLSIELAAARSRLLTPRHILERLDHHIGAAMRLLSDGARDLPARQRTLRATIEWSYNLLSPAEQRLLRQLAVFVGGWTLEAAEDVCQPQAWRRRRAAAIARRPEPGAAVGQRVRRDMVLPAGDDPRVRAGAVGEQR